MRIKKLLLIILSCTLILSVSFVFKVSKPSNRLNKSKTINGTYVSTSDSFISMSFDEADDCTFYFYYIDVGKQKLDKGKYAHKSNDTFIINSGKFINQEIHYQNNGFTIIIDGVKHTFKKIDDVPYIILIPNS